ncbi:MAG: class I SAM-dependent methyltransferase, partial [Anaerolineales bacterium]
MPPPEARFGEERLLRGGGERAFFRLFGVADPAHWLHFAYFERFLGRLGMWAPRRILDAGSGPGDFSLYLGRRFPSAEVLGIEISAARVQHSTVAAERLGLGNVGFEQADLRVLDRVAEFDLVCAIDVLEHIPEQQAVLERLHGALRPGGRAFLHLPTVRARPVPFHRQLKEFHRWAEGEHVADDLTPTQFVERVKRVGFLVDHAIPTFGYWTGELATSLFNLPYRQTARNRIIQAALAPLCRLLALAD